MQEQWRGVTRGMTSVCVILLAAWGVMGDVAAAELRKCKLPSGQPVYVSDACPAGSHEVWQRVVTADPRHDLALKQRQDDISQWQQASRRETASRLRPLALRGSGGRSSSDSSMAVRCERARERRDRIRDKEWMRMTYDRMIQLDDAVSEACR